MASKLSSVMDIIQSYDGNQKTLRQKHFITLGRNQFLDYHRQIFTQRFRFEVEGSDIFTAEKQRNFLEYIFDYGSAGIKFENGLIEMIGYVTGEERDVNGNITSGTLGIDFSNNSFTSDKLTSSNTAFASYSRKGNSPLSNVYLNSVMYAEALAALRSSVKNAVQKIELNTAMGTEAYNAFVNAYNDCETLVKAPTTTSMASMNMEDPSTALVDTTTRLLDTIGASRYELEQFEATIAFIKQNACEMLGVRTNSNFKRERNITAEFMWTDISFSMIEKYLLTMFDNFMTEFTRISGLNIKLINVIDERLEQLAQTKQSMTASPTMPAGDVMNEEITGGDQ